MYTDPQLRIIDFTTELLDRGASTDMVRDALTAMSKCNTMSVWNALVNLGGLDARVRRTCRTDRHSTRAWSDLYVITFNDDGWNPWILRPSSITPDLIDRCLPVT